MPTDLFVYGSLLFADVFRGVTGVDAECIPATLLEHARYRVRDATYPAIVPEPGARTEGGVYRELSDAAMCALDRFEGNMYTRERVTVELRDAHTIEVETYVCAEAFRQLLEVELWHPDELTTAARVALGGDDD